MGERPPSPPYRIRTERLVLRCYDPVDAPLLVAAVGESVEHLKPWMPWAYDEPQTLAQKVELLRTFRGNFDLDRNHVYGAFDPEETRVLGGSGIHPRVEPAAREIGYWVRSGSTRQGLATEMTGALVRVGFEHMGLERIDIQCDHRNLPSARVAELLGFTHEATLRRRSPARTEPPGDSQLWTLFADEYPGSPATRAQLEAFDAAGRRLL